MEGWKGIVICLVILLLCYVFVHTPSSNWNNGYCPNDGTKYQLEAVNGRLYQEYWVCPECGEVATK